MNWKNFYEKRINSTYQDYFNKKYEFMFNFILSLNVKAVKEEGVGIGSVMKGLPLSINCFGTDLCMDMLDLCRRNNLERNPTLWIEDITTGCGTDLFNHKHADLCISHGVLEHFSDEQIVNIVNRQKRNYTTVLHYVPTDGYDKPSFGDERLLPYDYWCNLVKPHMAYLENDNKDLFLIF